MLLLLGPSPSKKMNRKEKWWFFGIRGTTLFAYRYWWLVLLGFLLAFYFLYKGISEGQSSRCEDEWKLIHKIDSVQNLLDSCCSKLAMADSIPVPENAAPCNISVNESGGKGYFEKYHSLGNVAGNVVINYNMYRKSDRIDVIYNDVVVASSGGLVSGTGSLSFYYPASPGLPTLCKVVLKAPVDGTSWDYFLNCPENSR